MQHIASNINVLCAFLAELEFIILKVLKCKITFFVAWVGLSLSSIVLGLEIPVIVGCPGSKRSPCCMALKVGYTPWGALGKINLGGKEIG